MGKCDGKNYEKSVFETFMFRYKTVKVENELDTPEKAGFFLYFFLYICIYIFL